MRTAQLTSTRRSSVGAVDRRLFGSFVEHMGRCVYTGIYEPGHPSADADGFRRDVLELTRELGRHRWSATPAATSSPATAGRTASARSTSGRRRLDLAWRAIETNQFGLDEFMAWAAQGRRRADDGGQPRHPRHPGGRRPAGVLQPPGRHPLSDLRRDARRRGAVRDQAVVPGQRDGRPVADRPQDRRRVRPAGRGDREGDAPGRPRHRAGRLRQLQPRHADLRRVGGDRAGAAPTSRSTTSRCTTYYEPPTATWPASWPPPMDMDRFIDEVVATADHVGAKRAAARSSTSPSTSGTSGTSRASRPSWTGATGRSRRR